MTTQEFEAQGNNTNGVWVGILHKGKWETAFYHNNRYYFNAKTTQCYMSECITEVEL